MSTSPRTSSSTSHTDGRGGPLLAISVSREGIARTLEGRQPWRWTVRVNGATVATGTDLQTAQGNTDSSEAIRALHSFLSAWVESIGYGPDGENVDLFPVAMFDLIDDWDTALFEIGCEIGVYSEEGES